MIPDDIGEGNHAESQEREDRDNIQERFKIGGGAEATDETTVPPFGSQHLVNDPNAPPVDEELLRRLERGELDEEQRRETLKLIATYESWNRAAMNIWAEQLKNRLGCN